MNKVYLFDVDGTLTPARQKMDDKFAAFFAEFALRHNVFLISGSDYLKICEQVPADVLRLCNGVFGCSGAEYYEKEKVVYRKEHAFDNAIVQKCESFVALSAYHSRFGNHMEFRVGMLNVSTVGRNASNDERKTYHQWDNIHRERMEFVREVNEMNIGYEASAGGEISIDIVPTGWNKSVVKSEVLRMKPGARLYFFGDRMEEGGNDYPLAAALNSPSGRHASISVSSYEDTMDHLERIMDGTDKNAA